jgi:hypothetical protein
MVDLSILCFPGRLWGPAGPTPFSPGRPQLQAAAAGLVRGPDHAARPDAATGTGGGGGAGKVPGGGGGLGEVPWKGGFRGLELCYALGFHGILCDFYQMLIGFYRIEWDFNSEHDRV